MTPLPKMPRLKRLPKAKTNDCRCGCGTKTANKFAPGHDSRLKGWMLRIERGLLKLEDIPDGERQAVEAAIVGSTVETVVEKTETKKERKAREKQANIDAQLASINGADAAAA